MNAASMNPAATNDAPMDALPLSVGAPSGQWRAELLQMVNWGGFEGHHGIQFAQGSTLVSGASGTGKSTMLDAYIALMMPSDTPFNGASNEAGGRARSSEQRNLLTYLRGKTDENSVDGSRERGDLVLRGEGGKPTWGALAMTFVNDVGRRYTVARIFFVKSGARVNSDVTTTFFAAEGAFDLADLEPLAVTRFDRRALRARFGHLVLFDSFRDFEVNLHTRLGIGDAQGGRKAMRLLARVQSGMQVKSVDGLYKSMVLEEPPTVAAADEALAHFATIDASYRKMVDEGDKVQVLRRLPELQDEVAAAEDELLTIAQLGVLDAARDDAATPWQLWLLRTELGLVDEALATNRQEHADAVAHHAAAMTTEAGLARRLSELEELKRANGGDALALLEAQERQVRVTHENVSANATRFQMRTQALDVDVPATAEEFAAAQRQSQGFLDTFEEQNAALKAQEDEVTERRIAPLVACQHDLLQERASLENRVGMVPRRLHEARVLMARAAGLDPENDLPFVAELLDVAPGEERWRRAIETTLGGLARVVLVDRERLENLSAAIDGLKISPRVHFQAVTLTEHAPRSGDPERISGKLVHKDSPFSGWVHHRVTEDALDHRCVETAAELRGDAAAGRGGGPRVTLSGQTRDGDKGAHGELGGHSIIGFSNERRVAELQEQLSELDPQLAEARRARDDLAAQRDGLRAQRDAHRIVVDTRWEEIDHRGVAEQLDRLAQQIVDLRASNAVLDGLQKEQDELRPQHDAALRDRVISEEQVAGLDREHATLTERRTSGAQALADVEAAQSVTLTAQQRSLLDERLAAQAGDVTLAHFHTMARAVRDQLRGDAGRAEKAIRRAHEAMADMFAVFNQRWEERNLDTLHTSADEYRAILDRIVAEGLYERREAWRRELASWSSDDLLGLSEAFDAAGREIEDRLRPVNAILAELPFGGKGHLQIMPRRLVSDEVTQFRRRLRALSSGLAVELSDAQVETRFEQLREFMESLQPASSGSKARGTRDRYLDVRQHFDITAVCVDDEGREVATYASLGGKSGGESQELVAFIVGAALRYQLGDESRSWPRFAPVFLDEGFVKSDSEFAGRAVKAWQDLGFQLIVGAPHDKVTALEPYMERLLTVTKNARGYSFVTELRGVEE